MVVPWWDSMRTLGRGLWEEAMGEVEIVRMKNYSVTPEQVSQERRGDATRSGYDIAFDFLSQYDPLFT